MDPKTVQIQVSYDKFIQRAHLLAKHGDHDTAGMLIQAVEVMSELDRRLKPLPAETTPRPVEQGDST